MIFQGEMLNSGDGMLTSVWGPAFWLFLHIVSFSYPLHPTSQDRENYREFMELLVYVLPCRYCRENLVQNYKDFPLKSADFSDRRAFSTYVYALHERVNKQLKKKVKLTYAEVKDRYDGFRLANGFNYKCQVSIVPNRTGRKTHNIGRATRKTRPVEDESEMIPAVWGPALWHVLHTISFNYPVAPTAADQKNYAQFFRCLVHVLPLKAARVNLAKAYGEEAPAMESREALSRYVFRLHERINGYLGARGGHTFEEVRERYEHFRARCRVNDPKTKKEGKGCTVPLYGKKAQCILNIVDKKVRQSKFRVAKTCKLKVCKSAKTSR
jgi:hypothetical protein